MSASGLKPPIESDVTPVLSASERAFQGPSYYVHSMRTRSAREIAFPPFIEEGIVKVLSLSPRAGESEQQSLLAKEKAVGHLLEHLSPEQYRALVNRIDVDRDDDRLAVAFRRITSDWRSRLRAQIANTPDQFSVSRYT